MINEFDINDWQMLTEPLLLDELKKHDRFSIHGSDAIFEYMVSVNDGVMAMTTSNQSPFVFPKFMQVYPWKRQQNTKVSPTGN
jgi:hypothetical protein